MTEDNHNLLGITGHAPTVTQTNRKPAALFVPPATLGITGHAPTIETKPAVPPVPAERARYRDWQSRLDAFIRSRFEMPFEWGKNDCATFVADAAFAQTGHDPAEGLRGYSTGEEAVRLMAEHGGLARLAAARFGDEIAVALAQVGDVGLVEIEGREMLALCAADGWLVPGPDHLERLAFTAAIRSWRVI